MILYLFFLVQRDPGSYPAANSFYARIVEIHVDDPSRQWMLIQVSVPFFRKATIWKIFADENSVFFFSPRHTDFMSRWHLLSLWEYDLVHHFKGILSGAPLLALYANTIISVYLIFY